MDTIDKKILMLLQQNAKQNTKEIADQVGLSVSPTYERIKKLEEQYIENYVALLKQDEIDKKITAFCYVSLEKHSKPLITNFKKQVVSLPEIMACYHVSGKYDFLLKIVVKDIKQYQDFVVEKLSTLTEISHLQSTFVMENIKDSTVHELYTN